MKELCLRCKRDMRQKYRVVKPKRKKRTPSEPVAGPVIMSVEYAQLVHSVLRDKRDRELVESYRKC